MGVVEEVKKLDWPKESYVVIGSGILDALGIRKAADIDFVVDRKLYDRLKRGGWKEKEFEPGRFKLKRGAMDVGMDWQDEGKLLRLEDFRGRTQVVHGVRFASLGFIRGWKDRANRPKDRRDIELIDRYLSSVR